MVMQVSSMQSSISFQYDLHYGKHMKKQGPLSDTAYTCFTKRMAYDVRGIVGMQEQLTCYLGKDHQIQCDSAKTAQDPWGT